MQTDNMEIIMELIWFFPSFFSQILIYFPLVNR